MGMLDRTRNETEPKLLLPGLTRFYDHAIPLSWVIIRIAVGLNLAIHGWGKIGRSGGPGQLIQKLPQSAAIGDEITFVLMLIEFVGGLCIVAGFFTRFWAAAAAVEMGVLTFYIYWGNGYGWLTRGYEYTLMWGLVLFAVALRGGGPWSIDRRLGREL
jgi:putative oxidoreductase